MAAPTEINHIKADRLVRVTWDDGHAGDYAEEYLRGWCPCAGCQGHSGGVKFIPVEDSALAGISAVGNYAIMFHWKNGHDTGIYTYEFLRALCPCAECKNLSESAER